MSDAYGHPHAARSAAAAVIRLSCAAARFGAMSLQRDMEEVATGHVLGDVQSVVRVLPSDAQLDHLQAICQLGATYSEIAECLGVPANLLLWWAQQDDEAGDALRVTRAIQMARADLKI